MLKLTKTGIGLLTRLYRSVLQKCWLINIGVWALGAVGKTVSTLLPQSLRGTLNDKTFNVIEKLLQTALMSGSAAGEDVAELKKLLQKLEQKYGEAAENGANTFGKMTNVPTHQVSQTPDGGTLTSADIKALARLLRNVLINNNVKENELTDCEKSAEIEDAIAGLLHNEGLLNGGFNKNSRQIWNESEKSANSGAVSEASDGRGQLEYGVFKLIADLLQIVRLYKEFMKKFQQNFHTSLITTTALTMSLVGAVTFAGAFMFPSIARAAHIYNTIIGSASDYSYISYDTQGNPVYYKIELLTDNMGSNASGNKINWTNSGTTESSVSFSTTSRTATGTISVKMLENGALTTKYYTYNYTTPYTTNQTVNGTANNVYFYNRSGTNTNGGATQNRAVNNADFIRNSAYNGGAVYQPTTSSNFSGNFIGNSGTSSGGALYLNANSNAIVGDFVNNIADSYGGAIVNVGDTWETITSITGNFIANKTSRAAFVYGGALKLYGTNVGTITGSFIGNGITNTITGYDNGYAHGGAISDTNQGYHIDYLIGDFIGNYVNAPNATSYTSSGAIHFVGASGGIDNIEGDFIGNWVLSAGTAYGGAIGAERGSISRMVSNFIGNYVETTGGAASGGAINGQPTINYLKGDFIGNNAITTAANKSAYGGALDVGGTVNFYESSFIGNYVQAVSAKYAHGGALNLYNNSTYSITAQDKDIVFYNNREIDTTTRYNDINTQNATINLNASNGKSITFNGTITALEDGGAANSATTNILNLNTNSEYYGGSYIFNNAITNHTINLGSSTVTNHPVTIKLGTVTQTDGTTTYGSFDNTDVLVNYASNSILDTQNQHIDSNDLDDLTLNQSLGIKIDASLTHPTADTINPSTVSASYGSLAIQNINVGNWDENISIQLTTDTTLMKAYKLADGFTIADNISGDLADYIESVSYDNTTGKLNFTTKSMSIGGTIQSIKIGSGAVTPDASSGELTPDENKAITLGAAAARGVTTSVTTNSADLITSGGVKNFLDTNYSRKLTKISTFCDGLDGKIRVVNDNTTTAANDNTATVANDNADTSANIFKKAI